MVRSAITLAGSPPRDEETRRDVLIDDGKSRAMNTSPRSKEKHRVHILGAGAVGLFLASKLRLAFPKFPVQALVRDSQNSVVPSDDSGPYFSGKIGGSGGAKRPDMRKSTQTVYITVSFLHSYQNKLRMQTIPIPVERILPSNVDGPQKRIRNLIVATKAYSAIDAIDSVKHRFLNPLTDGDKTNIVLIGNGVLGIRDELLKGDRISLPDINIHIGFTTHGVVREQSRMDAGTEITRIHHTGVGHIQLPSSWGQENGIEWSGLLDQAGLECRPPVSEGQMEEALWLKLAANCVINPLTALHKCTNGELWTELSDFATIQRKIVEEVSQVAMAERSLRMSSDVSNNPANDSLSVENMMSFCNQVILDTKNNQSSMLQDVLNSRLTEADYLTGYIVDKGLKLSIPTPSNSALLERIHNLQLTFDSKNN